MMGLLALPVLSCLAVAQPAMPLVRDSGAVARPTLPRVEVVAPTADARARFPGAVRVVDAARLSAVPEVSVKDALRSVPGVHVMDEDAFGLNLNIGLRGLPARRSQRVLLLEDGMPIHLGPYSDPSAHYHPPVDALERIEVVTGASQIAFGPQTVGGVINFVRRAPPRTPTARLTLAGGGRDLRTGRLSLGGTWRERGLIVDAGHRAGAGTRDDHAHRVDDLSVRTTLPLGRAQRLALSMGLYREASRYGEAGLSQVEFDRNPFANPLPNDVFDLSRQAAQLVHESAIGRWGTLRTQLYGQRIDRTAWRQASTSADRLDSPSYRTAFRCVAGATSVDQCGNTGRPRRYRFGGIEPRLTAVHRLGQATAQLEAGARVHEETMRRQERDGATATARTGPLSRDNEIITHARSAFVREQITLGALTLTPGLRVEQVESRNRNRLAGTSGSGRYTEWLPGIGGVWTVRDTGSVRISVLAGAHRGFAPPRPADVLNPVAGEGLVQVDAETSVTTEFGTRIAFRNSATLDVTMFDLAYDNQVVRGSLLNIGQRFVNAGRTRHRGVEVGSTMPVGLALQALGAGPWSQALSIDAALTYLPVARFADARNSTVDAQQSVRGRRLPFAPRSLIRAGLRWDDRAARAQLRLEVDAVGAQFADDVNSAVPSAQGRRGVIPAYSVINASARVPLWRDRGAGALTLSIRNLTNRVYITDRSEGIMTGMPRVVLIGTDLALGSPRW
jgi:Fe(3+) dicitrate transport protein